MKRLPANLSIAPCRHHDRAEALRLVFSGLPEPDREGMVRGLLAERESGGDDLGGVLTARCGGTIVGAIWAQVQAGRTAVLWPPATLHGEASELNAPLIAAALEFLESAGTALAQTLLRGSEMPLASAFQNAGFEKLTDLVYLVAPACTPTASPSWPLQFEPYRSSERARLGRLIERTYVGSLDCPTIDGAREIDDVVAGYQATGVFDPSRWFFARHADRDAGVLLLADHPPAKHWELVYMGIVPEARGRGWGEMVARHALEQAGKSGAEQVVLAVDAKNTHGRTAYARAGFSEWDRRTVLLKQFAGSSG